MDGKTAAIVVTYNRLPMLRRCIEALRSQTEPCDILVIDNASTDGTAQWVTAQADVRYHSTGENIGGAGGFNRGLRLAMQRGYDFLWLMDDDCLPEEDALRQLHRAGQGLGGHYGWLSSVALWTDGEVCLMNRQKLVPGNADLRQCTEPILAKEASFVSLFLQSAVVETVGLPIREFFIWGDDVEYTRRIAVRFGRLGYVVPRSRVIHAMASNSGSNLAIDDVTRIPRYRYAFRNENFLYRQEGWRGFAYYTAKCLVNLGRILIKAKDRRAERCKVILSCYFKGLQFNPSIEKVTKGEPGEDKA